MDVATGTGIWAIQFAEQNPDSYVIGTDLSKIQPNVQLPNIEFLKEDAEADWVYPHIPKFDFIHLRFVLSCFNNPKKVLQQALDNLNPGGWIEYHDFYPAAMSLDGTHEGTIMEKYWKLFADGLAAKGRDPTIPAQYKGWLHEAGLVDVGELTFAMPGCAWPDDPKLKRIGQYMYVDGCEMVRGAGWHLFQGLGLSTEEVEDLVKQYKKDSRDPRIHHFYRMYVVYGRKPLDSETS
jgi:SAM-dependent methyltransferase